MSYLGEVIDDCLVLEYVSFCLLDDLQLTALLLGA